MSTHKTREELNNVIYEQNHKTLETALKTARSWSGSEHVSVSQLHKKTGLKRDTIYYHLLGDRRPGITEEKRRKGFLQTGEIKKEKGCYIWITCWERSNAIKRSFELLTSLIENSEEDAEAENVKGGIFSENIFIFTPFTRGNGAKSFTCLYYPLKELEHHPEVFLTDYLNWKKQVEDNTWYTFDLLGLPKQDFEDLREMVRKDLIKKFPQFASGEGPSEEVLDKVVENMSKTPVPVGGQIITFRYTRDNKKYTAGLITE